MHQSTKSKPLARDMHFNAVDHNFAIKLEAIKKDSPFLGKCLMSFKFLSIMWLYSVHTLIQFSFSPAE